MAYRDDLGAAQQRIVELESDLEYKKREATRLEATLSSTATELNKLRGKVGGAPRATRARLIVIGSVVFLSIGLAGTLGYVRLAEEAEDARAERTQAQVQVSKLKREIARLQRDLDRSRPLSFGEPVDAPASTPPARGPEAPYDANGHKALLLAKVGQGKATTDEARMLKSICMADGDRSCRNEATEYFQDLKQRELH